MTGILDELLRQIQRAFTATPGRPCRAPRPTATFPGEPVSARRSTAAVRLVIACVGSIAFGAALIPLREVLIQSISLLMVIPVLLVAATAGARLAAVAAVSAALTFDVLHTVPYYRLTIDDPDDIVEMVVLLVIGVLTGLITESAQRAIVGTRVRQRELQAITDFVDRTYAGSPEELVADAQRSIEALLLARRSDWRPGYRGTASAVLTRSGSITAGVHPTARRSSTSLPTDLEIPVGTPPTEHGRFVVRSSDADISIEERRAAATIAAALGRAFGASGVVPGGRQRSV